MAAFRSGWALRQDLWAILSHQDSVFELGGELSIFGSHRPVVGSVEFGKARTDVDHRFDREAHTGEQAFLAALAIGNVRNVRVLVEPLAQPVADIFADHGEPSLGRFSNDIVADDTYGASWLQSGDGTVHCIESALGDGAGFIGDRPDQKRFRLIAMPTVDD